MRFIKKGIFYLCMVCFLACSSVNVAAECLAFPPVCPIEACGYQTQESTFEQILQLIITLYKTTKKTVKTARKSVSNITRMAVTLPAAVSSLALKAITYPFEKLSEWTGLTEDVQEEDIEGITQDTSHGDFSVSERINKDLKAYATEPNADFKTQHFNQQRRKYIRQQATITLLARVLQLKAQFEDIKKILDETSNQVKRNVSASSGEPSKTYNESALIKTNYELRQAWFELLLIQRNIEAVKLEYAANQAMAGMPLLKKVPTITTKESNEKK